MTKDEVWFKKSRLVNPLIAFYFFIAFVEIIAEYNGDQDVVKFTKPFCIPLLLFLYWITSKEHNKGYVLSLLFAIGSSVILTNESVTSLITGSVLMLLTQAAIINVIIQKVKFPKANLLLVSALPFFILCALVSVVVFQASIIQFFMFVVQTFLISFFGGLALSNYLTKYNIANTQLLLSAIFLSLSQLLVALLVAFENGGILLPLSTVFFILGHYLMYKFIRSQEKKQKRYKIIN